MKSDLLSFLETRREDELAKLLAWAYFTQSNIDDKTPYEIRVANAVKNAIYELEKSK